MPAVMAKDAGPRIQGHVCTVWARIRGGPKARWAAEDG